MRTFIAAAALCLAATPTWAQIACGHLAELLDYGATELGQYVQVNMANTQGAEIFILADAEGNWSLIMANGDQACVMAVGVEFEAATGL